MQTNLTVVQYLLKLVMDEMTNPLWLEIQELSFADPAFDSYVIKNNIELKERIARIESAVSVLIEESQNGWINKLLRKQRLGKKENGCDSHISTNS